MNTLWRCAWTERLPNWLWLLALGIALLPIWQWCAARLVDGSDDPLGIVALLSVAGVVLRDRRQFMHAPRPMWLLSAVTLTALAILAATPLPPLVRGVVAILALSAMLMAIRNGRRPMLAIVALGVLALPLLSSLQFFIGYPLRVLTAEATVWLLGWGGQEALRSGSALIIAGQMVMVDAPCSGIQMGWMAYFTAATVAAWRQLADGHFLRRLPIVGLIVLLGNILRNTVLVVKEAGLLAWPPWTHEAVGVLAFVFVCAAVLAVMLKSTPTAGLREQLELPLRPFSPAHPEARLRAAALGVFAIVAVWPLMHTPAGAGESPAVTIEWPLDYEGRALRPLALSAVEQRFADRFPGAIGRFDNGDSIVVLRRVHRPTRMLHPASDCFRGLGYRISDDRLIRDSAEAAGPRLRRCFIASKDGQHLQVCEHIVDAMGTAYTDTSSWYWAAVTGQTRGPWQAVTQARPL